MRCRPPTSCITSPEWHARHSPDPDPGTCPGLFPAPFRVGINGEPEEAADPCQAHGPGPREGPMPLPGRGRSDAKAGGCCAAGLACPHCRDDAHAKTGRAGFGHSGDLLTAMRTSNLASAPRGVPNGSRQVGHAPRTPPLAGRVRGRCRGVARDGPQDARSGCPKLPDVPGQDKINA